MKQARFQNTLRGKKKKKKALHRGTFEVVENFFLSMSGTREGERERVRRESTRVRVSLLVFRAVAVAVHVHHAQGQSAAQTLHSGMVSGVQTLCPRPRR